MRKLLFILLTSMALTGCDYRSVKGDGHVSSEDRTISTASKIKLMGSYDVALVQGTVPALKIEADGNLIPLIITENRDGWLIVRSKDHVNFSSDHEVRITITTPTLEDIELAGSGNITGKSKFTGADNLKIRISGSGDVALETNVPRVETHIAGSGNVDLAGEAKDVEVHIAGMGDYKGENLKAENARVDIAGSGDVKIFADSKLDVHIAGSGSVYYKGSPAITQRIAGSGEIKQVQ